MDIGTGKTYDTKAAALTDGVAESDIADIRPCRDQPVPKVKFSKGSFKKIEQPQER